jgi:hypothetical protein
LDASNKFKVEMKAERMKPSTLSVGDIVVNSWGWEQTNIDFYAVVKASEHFVWLQELSENRTENGWLRGTCEPIPGTEHGEITKHAVSYGNSVNFKHGSGSVWDGKPEHWTAYA